MHDTRLALLAGGMGVRMQRLGHRRLKPLVPFGGLCHLIDFSLHNARRSGAPEVLLMAQHNEAQLVRYLLDTWCTQPGFKVHFGLHEGVTPHDVEQTLARIPRPAERGTADALLKNGEHIFDCGFRDVMVLHADHVYLFDYRPMVAQHRASGAALTLGFQQIEPEYVKLFGMVEFDAQGRLRRFVEKPQQPTSNTVFSAVCVFDAEVLKRYLLQLEHTDWRHDISHDLIPAMLAGGERILGYRFDDYWEDIGTVERYMRANLRLLDQPPTMPLEQMPCTLFPQVRRRRVAEQGRMRHVIVPEDLRTGARIENSIVYPGARIADSAVVRNSLLLPGAVVGEGQVLERAIVLEPEAPGQATPCEVMQL